MTILPRLAPRKIPRKTLLSATILLLLLGLLGGSARAEEAIEGVWSFGGGAVAIQKQADGGYQGTVVSATTFAVCEHPVGQVMWTGMRERPDGSFWGLHLWYHGSACDIDPNRGLTAFRVITATGGKRVLIVCFSNPGDTSQPTIGPEGKTDGATYGCVESAPLAAVPGTGSGEIHFEDLLTPPASQPPPACRRRLVLLPRNPKYDPLEMIVVRIGGKKAVTITGAKRLHRRIVLGHLPEGRFHFRVTVVTALKQRFSQSRVYRGCSQKVKVKGHR